MTYPVTKRATCSACGLDTLRHSGWFLVVENRWLDHLKILSWHPAIALHKEIKSVCCREHLRVLVAHWLTEGSLRLPPAVYPPMAIGSDANLPEVDLGPHAVGRLVGELAVHRKPFSRAWAGSPENLDYILDALTSTAVAPPAQDLELRFLDLPTSTHHVSRQPGVGGF